MSKSLKMRGACLQTALLLQTTSLRTALENHMAWISRGSVRQRFPMQTKWWSFWILLRTQRLQSVCAALLTPNNQKGEKCRSHHNGDCTFAGLSQWCFSSARPATILEAPEPNCRPRRQRLPQAPLALQREFSMTGKSNLFTWFPLPMYIVYIYI